MRRTIALSIISMSLAVFGCKKKEEATPTETGSGSAAAAPEAVAPAPTTPPEAAPTAPPATDGAKMAKRGGNCPSMVAGVTTAATADAAAVTVTITSDDPEAIASIQKRSEELLAEKADPAAGGAHDQKGTYGGGSGLCPVGTNGATAKFEKTAKGATFMLTPEAGTTVEQLKAKVDERITAANAYVAANIKPAGDGGKGDHGSNHSGDGDGKGKEKGKGKSDGTGGGGGAGTGGGSGGGTKTETK